MIVAAENSSEKLYACHHNLIINATWTKSLPVRQIFDDTVVIGQHSVITVDSESVSANFSTILKTTSR
jgi:hypothetical protein